MSWPSVKGEIIGTKIPYDVNSNYIGGSLGYYEPTIRYRYTVNNSTYESEKVRVGFFKQINPTFKISAEARIARYPMNSIIVILIRRILSMLQTHMMLEIHSQLHHKSSILLGLRLTYLLERKVNDQKTSWLFKPMMMLLPKPKILKKR